MILRESEQRIELTDLPVVPWLFAAIFIPFGLLLGAWAAGFIPSAHRPELAARISMIVLSLFATCLPVLMLRSFPRVRLVIDRDRGTISLDQWAMHRHARGEWSLSSIARIEIAKGVNLNIHGPRKTGYRLQLVLTDGSVIVPTPSWERRRTIESAAAAIGSALRVTVTSADKWQPIGFPDKTLFNSDMNIGGPGRRSSPQ